MRHTIRVRTSKDRSSSLLEQLKRVPRRLIWDDEPGIGRAQVLKPMAVFAGTLVTRVVLLSPRDPESRAWSTSQPFFETSFMLGRPCESPADLRTIIGRSVDLVAADKEAIPLLPQTVLH